jgi:hypothetical protein
MNIRDAATAVGGVVMVMATAAAGVTIRALLTAPTTVVGMLDAQDGQAIHVVVRALSDALWSIVRYL